MYLFLDEISQQDEGLRKPVLDRVSLYARPGEIVSLVGPADAGKTALLRFVGERSDGRDGVFASPGDAFPPRWRTEEWHGVTIRRYAFPNMALDGSGREPSGGWSEDADNVHFSVESRDGSVRGVGWKDIEVVRAPSGAPSIALHGRAKSRAERLGVVEISVSMSDSQDNAVAFVVTRREDPE